MSRYERSEMHLFSDSPSAAVLPSHQTPCSKYCTVSSIGLHEMLLLPISLMGSSSSLRQVPCHSPASLAQQPRRPLRQSPHQSPSCQHQAVPRQQPTVKLGHPQDSPTRQQEPLWPLTKPHSAVRQHATLCPTCGIDLHGLLDLFFIVLVQHAALLPVLCKQGLGLLGGPPGLVAPLVLGLQGGTDCSQIRLILR